MFQYSRCAVLAIASSAIVHSSFGRVGLLGIAAVLSQGDRGAPISPTGLAPTQFAFLGRPLTRAVDSVARHLPGVTPCRRAMRG